jgi:hypothetical protein
MRDRPYEEMMAELYRDDPWHVLGMFWELLTNHGERGEWKIYWRHVRLALRRRPSKTGT